jgi:hypothetical protein
LVLLAKKGEWLGLGSLQPAWKGQKSPGGGLFREYSGGLRTALPMLKRLKACL